MACLSLDGERVSHFSGGCRHVGEIESCDKREEVSFPFTCFESCGEADGEDDVSQ